MLVALILIMSFVNVFGDAAYPENTASEEDLVLLPPSQLELDPVLLNETREVWARERNRKTSPRIAIVSFNSLEAYFAQRQGGYDSKACYAAIHGYSWFLESRFPGSGWYAKVGLLEKYLRTEMFDWVVWMDSDIVITNYTTKLEWFLPSSEERQLDIVVTDHTYGVNTGVVMVRNSEFSFEFLREWASFVNDGYAFQDNGSFFNLILRRMFAAKGREYDDECQHPSYRRYGFWIVDCFRRRSEGLDASYPRGDVGNIRFVNPEEFRFSPEPNDVVRGAFNTFRMPDVDHDNETQYWEFTQFWKPGHFALHSARKYLVNVYIPDWFGPQCTPESVTKLYSHLRLMDDAITLDYCDSLGKNMYKSDRSVPGN